MILVQLKELTIVVMILYRTIVEIENIDRVFIALPTRFASSRKQKKEREENDRKRYPESILNLDGEKQIANDKPFQLLQSDELLYVLVLARCI